MTDQVLFSVIIPAYNCADSIADTVLSIFHAGLTEFEIIIVNDGSTDRTATVLAELSAIYSNVKVLTQRNGGVSSARNLGLSFAQGDYLFFVDADDVLEENAYCKATEIVLKTKPDMLLFGVCFEHYHKGICYQTENLVCPTEGLFADDAWNSALCTLFDCNYLSPVWNKFIKREIVQYGKIQFSEEMFIMEDCKFSLDCLRYCHLIYLLPEPIYHYQILDDGKKTSERIRRIKSLNSYMEQFVGLPKVFFEVVRKIHHMLLGLRFATAKTTAELEREVETFQQSPYYEDGIVPEKLLSGNYYSVLCSNFKRRLRHRAAVAYKCARLRLMRRRKKTESGLI